MRHNFSPTCLPAAVSLSRWPCASAAVSSEAACTTKFPFTGGLTAGGALPAGGVALEVGRPSSSASARAPSSVREEGELASALASALDVASGFAFGSGFGSGFGSDFDDGAGALIEGEDAMDGALMTGADADGGAAGADAAPVPGAGAPMPCTWPPESLSDSEEAGAESDGSKGVLRSGMRIAMLSGTG